MGRCIESKGYGICQRFCQMLYKALFVDRQKGYYNVGTGIGTSLLDQIKGIVEVFGDDNHKSQIKLNPNMPNAPQYIMDITPAIYELGYKPKYDYISMLKDMKAESKIESVILMSNILVTRSSMPSYEEYCEEIKDMWDTHWLTNMGPKHKNYKKN